MRIPHESVPPAALKAMLEEIASRDGTDYGETEMSLDAKISQMMLALKRGDLGLFWDTATETASLEPIVR